MVRGQGLTILRATPIYETVCCSLIHGTSSREVSPIRQNKHLVRLSGFMTSAIPRTGTGPISAPLMPSSCMEPGPLAFSSGLWVPEDAPSPPRVCRELVTGPWKFFAARPICLVGVVEPGKRLGDQGPPLWLLARLSLCGEVYKPSWISSPCVTDLLSCSFV
jgi:hypothetical protein